MRRRKAPIMPKFDRVINLGKMSTRTTYRGGFQGSFWDLLIIKPVLLVAIADIEYMSRL